MRVRPLGPTGTLVGELCLGTMTFGAETDEAAAHAQLDAFTEAGGNLIDTADVYTAGASETIIGRWLARRGGDDGLVVATKGRLPVDSEAGPNDQGLSAGYLRRALIASLERLGVDHVALYQVHVWDAVTPLAETIGALDRLIREGLIGHWGISNFTGWQLATAIHLARGQGLSEPVVLQAHYNLLGREVEWELVPCCVAEGIGILAWSPLGGGWLTGKYRRDARPEGASRLGEDPGRGIEAYDARNTDRTWRVVDALTEMAAVRDDGTTPAQLALRWVTDRPGVTSTILGARTTEQLADNLAAADVVLTEDERTRLDDASMIPAPEYPYGFIRGFATDRLDAIGASPLDRAAWTRARRN